MEAIYYTTNERAIINKLKSIFENAPDVTLDENDGYFKIKYHEYITASVGYDYSYYERNTNENSTATGKRYHGVTLYLGNLSSEDDFKHYNSIISSIPNGGYITTKRMSYYYDEESGSTWEEEMAMRELIYSKNGQVLKEVFKLQIPYVPGTSDNVHLYPTGSDGDVLPGCVIIYKTGNLNYGGTCIDIPISAVLISKTEDYELYITWEKYPRYMARRVDFSDINDSVFEDVTGKNLFYQIVLDSTIHSNRKMNIGFDMDNILVMLRARY